MKRFRKYEIDFKQTKEKSVFWEEVFKNTCKK